MSNKTVTTKTAFTVILRAGMAPLLATMLLSSGRLAAGQRRAPVAVASPGQIQPPPLPGNFYIDNLSDQTISGAKTFTRPVEADITGNALTANTFTGALSGDVSGTQAMTQIINVPFTALPAIGFGFNANTAKIKYVNGDAHPADTRRDGSIAHPYASLGIAAANAHDGDHFILTGTLSGNVVFSSAVTVQGSSSDQTTLYGSIEFGGFLASHLRNLRVNCTSDTACIVNRSTRSSDLELDHVTVAQSGVGPAIEARYGRLVAAHSAFSGSGGGPAVQLDTGSAAVSRLEECAVTGSGASIGLSVLGGGAVVEGGTYTSAGAAISMNTGSLWINNAHLVSGKVPLQVVDSTRVMVRGSLLEAGAGDNAVSLDINPVVTFAVDYMAPVFVQNQYVTDTGVAALGCSKPVSLLSSGNFNLKNIGASASDQVAVPCAILPATSF